MEGATAITDGFMIGRMQRVLGRRTGWGAGIQLER